MVDQPLHTTQKNIARLMVRRHLRSWMGSEIISESLLIALFMKTAREHPDKPMRDIASRVDGELRTLVGLMLDREPEEPDYLGLDPG